MQRTGLPQFKKIISKNNNVKTTGTLKKTIASSTTTAGKTFFKNFKLWFN